jgi:hypothetical protein
MEFFFAIAQSRLKLVLQLMKLVELPPDLRELLVQAATHRRARLQPCTPQFQQFPNLSERKSESLHTPNKSQSLDIAFAILAETARRARRTRQERTSLIETNCIGRQADLLRDCADLHDMAPSSKTYILEYSPESNVFRVEALWQERRRASQAEVKCR